MTLIPTSVVRVGGEDGRHELQATFTCDECNWLQLAHSTRFMQAGTGTSAANWPANVAQWFESRADLEWWPAVGVSKDFEDVPLHIADAASEAHRCHSIGAYRGATALARSVIEASAKDKGITKGMLHAKIDALQKAGHIRQHITEAAHEVRHLGNEVAHGDFVDPIDKLEAEEILALMGEVLQEVFQSPARVARVRETREAKQAAGKE